MAKLHSQPICCMETTMPGLHSNYVSEHSLTTMDGAVNRS